MSITVVPIKVVFMIFKNISYVAYDNDTRDAVLVDPAWEADKIDAVLAEHQVRLKCILITHTHKDHIHLAPEYAQRYSLPVVVAREEVESSGFTCDGITILEKDERFQYGSLDIRSIHTPGHSVGGTCYFVGENLFTGDTLFTEGCGACFGDVSRAKALFHSLKKLKTMVPPDTRIFPGHSFGKKPGYMFRELQRFNLYLSFSNEADFVEFRLRKNQKSIFNFS